MIDPRISKHAKILVNSSLKLKKNERVIVFGDIEAKPLMLEIYKELIHKEAGEIRLHFDSYEFSEIFFKLATDEQITAYPDIEDYEMKHVDCYIRIGSSTNTRGLSATDAEKIAERARNIRAIQDYRVEHTRWVVTKYPTNAQAQEADMSLNDYSDFVFNAMLNVDWKKKFKEQEKIRKLLDKTSIVHVRGPETDLKLGIKGRIAVNASGSHNMPDGEVFTSVIETQANGYITYTYPALYMGKEFHDVRLEFARGKVVKASAGKGESDLKKIISMDEGATRIGELGIGNNFEIKRFTKDILFDEKIGGSIHLALGKGYAETKSKNSSGLHWDMIKDLRKDGELWLDNKLVQKNGKWQTGVI